MIEFIRGTINAITDDALVIDNNNVGYHIFCPNPFSFLPIGQELTIYTYQYVREDAIHLYGFRSREERTLFSQLLSVSGIGPKGALAILATGEPGRVIQAIEAEEEAFLIKFPGIGKKTARQMILDLKGKLQAVDPVDKLDAEPAKEENEAALDEAVEALRALGYSDREIGRVKPELKEKALTAEQYVKTALKLMLNG